MRMIHGEAAEFRILYIKENSEGEKLSYVRKNNGETTGFRKKRKKTEKRQISEISADCGVNPQVLNRATPIKTTTRLSHR